MDGSVGQESCHRTMEKENIITKKIIRYNAATDIMMLREVLALNPFEAHEKWNEVASNFNIALQSLHPNVLEVNTRSVKERFDKLMKAFKAQLLESLRKSGCAEEYNERERILTEINALKEEAAVVAKTRRSNNNNMEIDGGIAIRKRAMETLTPDPKPKKKKSSAMRDYTEMKMQELDLRKQELAVRQQELQLQKQESQFRMQLASEEKLALLECLKALAKK